MQVIKPSVTLLCHTHEPERLIEQAGRTCWRSEERIDSQSHVEFVRMLRRKQHHSVLEHASATFRIVTDRGVANELVRHRIASYSQESTRYVRQADLKVIKPCRIDDGSAACHYWLNACMAAERNYGNLLDAGCLPQEARSVLPLCTATEIVATLNFRSWMNFLKQRTAVQAHPDMRILAHAIEEILIQIAPNVFGEVTASSQPDKIEQQQPQPSATT